MGHDLPRGARVPAALARAAHTRTMCRGEGSLFTQLSRSRRGLRTAAMGHEERFPPTRLSAGCGFRKETIAGRRRNGQDAPLRAIRGTEIERQGSTHSGRSFPSIAMPAHATKPSFRCARPSGDLVETGRSRRQKRQECSQWSSATRPTPRFVPISCGTSQECECCRRKVMGGYVANLATFGHRGCPILLPDSSLGQPYSLEHAVLRCPP